jgi:hypothetical protein
MMNRERTSLADHLIELAATAPSTCCDADADAGSAQPTLGDSAATARRFRNVSQTDLSETSQKLCIPKFAFAQLMHDPSVPA